MLIPIEVKKQCVALRNNGESARKIYREYFEKQFSKPQNYESFRRSLNRWEKTIFPDETTLECGTYKGFTAHGATVQVAANGDIVQAWIKQTAEAFDPEEFISALKQEVIPYEFKPCDHDDAEGMLEIPLFDMHWGISFMDYYEAVLNKVLEVIRQHHWKKIVVIFGQDFFHNDSIVNGLTTKGTLIQKVDMMRAVKEGRQFIYSIIDTAIEYATDVKVIYSAGNHDRSISWMFMQTLLERYGEDIVDDSLKSRKVITFGQNAIMVTHGDSKQATAKNLAHIFPISFPDEFANSVIREIHSGHLHTEREADIFGIMVRRLSSGVETDEWSDKEDFVGAIKRFMLFSWSTEKLKAIYYI